MVVFYLLAVLATCVAGGITWGISLLQLPVWAWICVGGAALPLYLGCALVYLAFIAQVFKVVCKETKEAPDGEEK